MRLLPSHPVLLVEDSPEDFDMIVRAFSKANTVNPFYHCVDGDEALDFLHQRGPYGDRDRAPRPAMILLDLNLPGTDGRQLLTEIKSNDHLKEIPVVVLTTSADERDVRSCYLAGANSYVQKPLDLAGLFSAIQRLKEFWFEIVH